MAHGKKRPLISILLIFSTTTYIEKWEVKS